MTRSDPFVRHPEDAEEYYSSERCHILETWNRADDNAVSVARARVPPGVATRWHALDGTAERYLIIEGHGRIELTGLEPEVVGPGDLVFIPPGCAQRISNLGTEDLVFAAICTPRYLSKAYRDLETTDGGQ
jgi:mannose-6-phosphate isomerase-like protein (cupin superfamily)